MDISKQLKQTAMDHGDRIALIPINDLEKVKSELDEFSKTQELNGFQQWIVHDLYSYEPTEQVDQAEEFEPKSVLLVAMHHPFYAKIEFTYEDTVYECLSLASSPVEKIDQYIRDIITKEGFHAKKAERLPLKRLSVQSGLAEYGRNNITVVEGMGSNYSLDGYLTDIPVTEDPWRAVTNAAQCKDCGICIEVCPTKAIRPERFLIDNQRCLSCMNESSDPFPDWVPDDIHHTFYDCLICQRACPINQGQEETVIGPITFSEEEIKKLLNGDAKETFSKQFQEKADMFDLFRWNAGLPRNLQAIMDNPKTKKHRIAAQKIS